MAADPISMGERELTQELAANGVEPPAKFFQKEVMPGVADRSLPVIDVPQVDISLLSSSCPLTAKAEADKLGSALSTYGCCLARNHGMASEFLDQVRQVLEDFFKLPLEEKSKCARQFGEWEGYGFDAIPENYGAHDWSDRLMIMISPRNLVKLQYWPDGNPPNFRETMDEWSSKLETLLDKVLKGMARSLEIDEKSFVEEMGEDRRVVARFNLYPKCSSADRILGINPHTDGSVITFLLQDKQVEGFQLLKDGEWFRVSVEPTDALLIKVGDQGEIISNGEFKAPLHRGALNGESSRTSMAIFCLPALDKTVGPVKGTVTETKGARYNNTTNYEVEYLQISNHRTLIESKQL